MKRVLTALAPLALVLLSGCYYNGLQTDPATSNSSGDYGQIGDGPGAAGVPTNPGSLGGG